MRKNTEVQRAWRAANPEKYLAACRRAEEARQARRQTDPEYRARIREQGRLRYHRRREAGVSVFRVAPQQEYEALIEVQQGVCAICRRTETAKDPSGRTKRLAIDHDHATGRLRGLLCARCNTAIGLLDDDWRRVQKASDYLAAFAALAVLDGAVAHVSPESQEAAMTVLDEALGR